MAVIPAGAAARSPATRLAMAAATAAALAADQATKSLVLAGQIADGSGPGWVTVRLVRNTGASGGFASSYPLLVTVTAAAITVAAVVLALRARSRAVALSLAVVVAGAAGNLTDRLLRSPGLGRGGVVDWIHFAGRGGSMNLADLAIQLGVLGALAGLVAAGRSRKASAVKAAR
jgi:signal peptidase II